MRLCPGQTVTRALQPHWHSTSLPTQPLPTYLIPHTFSSCDMNQPDSYLGLSPLSPHFRVSVELVKEVTVTSFTARPYPARSPTSSSCFATWSVSYRAEMHLRLSPPQDRGTTRLDPDVGGSSWRHLG